MIHKIINHKITNNKFFHYCHHQLLRTNTRIQQIPPPPTTTKLDPGTTPTTTTKDEDNTTKNQYSVSFNLFDDSAPKFLPWPTLQCFGTNKMTVHATAYSGNQYLIICEETRDAVMINFVDPHFYRWQLFTEQEEAQLKMIVQMDSQTPLVFGVDRMLSCRLALFHNINLSQHQPNNNSNHNNNNNEQPLYLFDNDILKIGNLRFQIIHTPSACSGAITLYEASQGVAWIGNLLTTNGGGTGTPHVLSAEQHSRRYESLKRLVWALPESTILFPSHYSPSYMGLERRINPDLIGLVGPSLSMPRSSLVYHPSVTSKLTTSNATTTLTTTSSIPSSNNDEQQTNNNLLSSSTSTTVVTTEGTNVPPPVDDTSSSPSSSKRRFWWLG
jgi:hypothetical protein